MRFQSAKTLFICFIFLNVLGAIVKSNAVTFPIIYNIKGGSSFNLKKNLLSEVQQWQKDIVEMARKDPENIIINGSTEDKVVYLTFDDGPKEKITPSILDILKQNNVKASFFFIGNRIKNNEKIVQRAYEEGHVVLNHSWSHPRLVTLTQDNIEKEIKETEDVLSTLVGKRPLLMRPPFGEVNSALLQTLKGLHYKIIIWSLDSFDWSKIEKDDIVDNVMSNVRPGEIILMHGKTETLKALPVIIEKLREQGYRFATVDSLV